MDFMSLKKIVFYSSTIKSRTTSEITIINALSRYSHNDYAMASHVSRALPFINVAMYEF